VYNLIVPPKPVTGVYAAVCTPRDREGVLDPTALRRTLEFLMERGVRGFALNGATGEYCLSTPGELACLLEVAAETIAGRANFLCGVGAAGLDGVLRNGRVAAAAGAQAVLLPMPHFFPYDQDDLEAFCGEVADRLSIDILLYNLPQFTTGLAIQTVCGLIARCPRIRGIKDSSGSLDILRELSVTRPEACRLVGNDTALVQALQEGVCDGVVSGVAGALPELILPLFQQGGPPDPEIASALHQFIRQIDGLPVPWGLKWIAESRGMAPARFNLPVSPRRACEGKSLVQWFETWRGTAPLT